jgi:cell division protein FtsB
LSCRSYEKAQHAYGHEQYKDNPDGFYHCFGFHIGMVAKESASRKKKRFHKKTFSILFACMLGGIVLFLFLSNITMFQRRTGLEKEASDLKAQIEDISRQTGDLEEKIAESKTDEYQERILREQGLYKKPGEEVITVLKGEEQKEEEKKAPVWWNPFTWW